MGEIILAMRTGPLVAMKSPVTVPYSRKSELDSCLDVRKIWSRGWQGLQESLAEVHQ